MKPQRSIPCIGVALLVLGFSTAFSYAQPAATREAVVAAPVIEGEVRKVDMDAQKVTLRHGPITNLDMPAMTMVFRVSDPSMLQKVQVGDKVRFKADKIAGAYTITELEPAK